MVLLSLSFDSLHGILRRLYDEMTELCQPMMTLATAIAALGALFYIAYRVWQSLSRAEPVDVFGMLRPFCLGICILFFDVIVLGSLNGILSPVVQGTGAMLHDQTFDVRKFQEEKDRLLSEMPLKVAVTGEFNPTDEELEKYGEPDFVVLNASKAKVKNYKELGLNSETAVVFNLTEKMQVIINTWYGGEMKKGMFSYMNYLLPLKGIASMHCSANTDKEGKNTAIFFGLSGTGKTTLSTDPKRELIGDDEHGWDDDGVFNFEGGCYAKVINLSKENEPDIWNAIRPNALLENVTVDKKGKIDFADKSVTENTRVSYPIFHIENIVKPVSKAPAAKKVIFLSADAFGVLPPVSILTPEQTKYYFLSGFTAKLAGTERGITEPTPTFSACFGAAFLSLHPTKYGEELVKRMKQSGATAYLVNTGWNGTGKRISIKDTRGIIDAILDGSIDKAPTKTLPVFDFKIPTALPGVDPKILDPRDTYKNAKEWDEKAADLAGRFVKNFEKFTGNAEGKKLVAAGPHLK